MELWSTDSYLVALYSTVEVEVFRTELPVELAPGLLTAQPVSSEVHDPADGAPVTERAERFAVWAHFLGEEDLDGDGVLDCEGPSEPMGCGTTTGCSAAGGGSIAWLGVLLLARRRERRP